MDVARRYVGARKGLVILDLGCGTGRFSVVLADSFDASVLAVEPSDKMRSVAESQSAHPRVRYVKGDAERIPVGDNLCDLAWLSMVLHHIGTVEAGAAELHRVLKPGGIVLIRNSFRGRLESVRYYEFFPSAMALDNARLPDAETVRKTFEKRRFRLVAFESVEQVVDRTFGEHIDRIRQRGLSTFELISDEEFQQGIRLMEDAAREEDPTKPVTEMIDLLVFARCQEGVEQCMRRGKRAAISSLGSCRSASVHHLGCTWFGSKCAYRTVVCTVWWPKNLPIS